MIQSFIKSATIAEHASRNIFFLPEVEERRQINSTVKTMDSSSHIKVRNLNVHIQKNHILKNVNLDIPNKAITCIIGPSGCGKTTLLKTFNRLIDQSTDVKIDGQVLLDGENIHGKNAEVISLRKKMGLLSQRPCPL